ncbi:WD40-repeat-containing domain protein [Xylariomycetidae sp. FL2044]|nr:WD40-repeat-containing domain protein [Xylariomycetidae sp. FL2044]
MDDDNTSTASSAPIQPHSPPRVASAKERRNPSVTPRKFKRFFTPRSRVPSTLSPARKALQHLGTAQLNRRYQTPPPSSPLKPLFEEGDHDPESPRSPQSMMSVKRRKMEHTPESTPPSGYTSPLVFGADLTKPFTFNSDLPGFKKAELTPLGDLESSMPCSQNPSVSDEVLMYSSEDDTEMKFLPIHRPIKRLIPLATRGLASQTAEREFGGLPRAGVSPRSCLGGDFRIETADFQSQPNDAHYCTSHNGSPRCIPFAIASCHTNSLTALGDEEGTVRMLDSGGDPKAPFSKMHLKFQAHSNAIIDLEFSNDDRLLATAAGDQTGRVIDVMSQQPIAALCQHVASLKQIRFQPGQANNSVLATSSRDGSVQIWDLRCAGPPVEKISPVYQRGLRYGNNRSLKTGCVVNSFYNAHARTCTPWAACSGKSREQAKLPVVKHGGVSVTALQFMPAGREHLLLTGSDADATINLWDIRSVHTSRNKVSTPLAYTVPPESHLRWRSFGISSLALGTDGARLYAACKDNTVYAYSTAHLIQGSAREIPRTGVENSRRAYYTMNHNPYPGLGPLYGFRHPNFHATSFYAKCAVRPACNGRSELLAIGSNDACAVLFPTDERRFRHDLSGMVNNVTLENSTISTSTAMPASGPFLTTDFSGRLQDNIPIVRDGTALINGHDKEVGAVAWTNQGHLVTVGDDYYVRCWREDRDQAADLRTGGEGEGRRWRRGWADVGDDWDIPDDDDED